LSQHHADEKVVKVKQYLDIESLRSDSVGIFWQLQYSNADECFLVVGASPASLEHGVNVFGSSDVQHCATVLLRSAGRALSCILPSFHAWQCRRLDYTENYDLGSPDAVKQAQRYLGTPKVSSRNRVSCGKGDSVYFMAGAKRKQGIGYHKGPHLAQLLKTKPGLFPAHYVDLSASLLRLELRLLREFWVEFDQLPLHKRELDRPDDMAHTNGAPPQPKQWFDFSESDLSALHSQFFDRFIGSVEVTDMSALLQKLNSVCETPRRAKSAYDMFCAIRADGMSLTQSRVSKTTWYRNLGYLYAAGLSVSDIGAGQVIQLRRDTISIDE